MRITVFLLTLLLAGSAYAQQWVAWSSVGTDTDNVSSIAPGTTAFYDIANPSTTDPARLRTQRCGAGSSVRLIANVADTTGIATNGITVKVYGCAQSTGTGAAGCRLFHDVGLGTDTLDGVSSTGTATLYGPLGAWTFVDVLATPATGTARIEVACR